MIYCGRFSCSPSTGPRSATPSHKYLLCSHNLYNKLNTNSHRFFETTTTMKTHLVFFLLDLLLDGTRASSSSSLRGLLEEDRQLQDKTMFTACLAPRAGDLLNVVLGDAPRTHVSAPGSKSLGPRRDWKDQKVLKETPVLREYTRVGGHYTPRGYCALTGAL